MAGPDYGILGSTFKIARMLQIISLIACIGMAANFISDMVTNNESPSRELVGTLSVVSQPITIYFTLASRRRLIVVVIRHVSRFSTAQSRSSSTWTAACHI